MYRIDMPHLLWVMDELARGKVVNRIQVHPGVRRWALVALDRMLAITGRTQHGTAAPTDSLSLVD
jgi:quinolinate synthase